jgi:hypothetical protein
MNKNNRTGRVHVDTTETLSRNRMIVIVLAVALGCACLAGVVMPYLARAWAR